MKIRSNGYVASLVIATIVVSVVWVCSTNIDKLTRSFVTSVVNLKLHTAEDGGRLFVNWTSIVMAPNVVLPAYFDSVNETFDCKTTVLINMTFPICIYTAEVDDTVSGLMWRGIYYEADEVSHFLRLFHLDQRLQLVDIGANVGLFSLPAARVTQVLAVEPNSHSMSRLAKGVDLGAVSSNITLIHNAVSNVRSTFNMGVHPTNQGNAFLINTTKCKATPTNKPCNTLSPIRTILLDDLLPLMRSKAALMKVDVEGHEVNVFTDSTAGKFFDQIDVPVVFMEWNLCKRHSPDTVQRLLNFFYSRNYSVFDVNNSELKKHYLSWPENVLFKKLTHLRF